MCVRACIYSVCVCVRARVRAYMRAWHGACRPWQLLGVEIVRRPLAHSTVVEVSSVAPDGPAAAASLRVADRIIAVEGRLLQRDVTEEP